MRNPIYLSMLILFSVLVLVSCSKEVNPVERASDLSSAILKVVRLQQEAIGQKRDYHTALAETDSLFNRMLKTDLESIDHYIQTGSSSYVDNFEQFITSAEKLHSPKVMPGEPDVVIAKILKAQPETAGKELGAMAGYQAAFLMCMEIERDGTDLQKLLPPLAVMNVPLTFKDFGLQDASLERIREIASEASSISTAETFYGTTANDFFMAMVKLDSWGSKFKRQLTADSLASRILRNPAHKNLLVSLAMLPKQTIVFLGDSNMDEIHWSTVAPFPNIVSATLKRVNPKIKIVNSGKGGDDSSEALERFGPDVIAHKPQLTFIMLGGNDCHHWGGPDPAVTPEQFRSNICRMVDELRSIGSRVVLMTYPEGPELEGDDLVVFRQIVEQTKEVADSLHTLTFDSASIINEMGKDKAYAVDNIHHNKDAHLAIANKLLYFIAPRCIRLTELKRTAIFWS